jgi:L-arabinose isomerase
MRIPRRKARTARVGLFGVGYHVYWGQFPGLLDELKAKLAVLEERLAATGMELFSYGVVDSAEAATAAAGRMQADRLDLLFCDMLTYATSASIAAILRHVDVPVVLVALQPLESLDYARATTYMQLANDDFCAVPEFMGVAERLRRPIADVIVGTLHNDAAAEADLRRWCDIAMVLHDLKSARIGHFGHPLEHMLDMQTDQTALTAAFGCQIVQTEADELLELDEQVTMEEVAAKQTEILALFDTPEPGADQLTRKLTAEDLQTSAHVAVILDKFVDEHHLDGLAYYYAGRAESRLRQIVSNLIVGNSLLTAAGFPMCGESDLKTCVAMLIMDRLDIGGSFAEFHPIDFREGFVLVGHDGPHHLNIASARPALRSLTRYHGKPGAGAGVEFRIKEGPITMLSIGVTGAGAFRFVLAEGLSVEGPIPATGNTNTRGFFRPDIRTFLKRWVSAGPTHHFALGVGHHAATLTQIARILGIESVVVSEEGAKC